MNNTLNLKESLRVLNLILMYKEDLDWDSEGVIYLSVNYDKAKPYIEFLIGSHTRFKEYVDEFLEDGAIEINVLWAKISQKFKKDIWYNEKTNKFHVARWYHVIRHYYDRIKINIENQISRKKEAYKIHKYYKKLDRETKRRIKTLKNER